MSSCKTTNFPNGIRIGGCLELDPGIVLPSFPDNIVEVSAAQSPYSMTGSEDIIFCTGIVEILMIPISSAVKSLIVNTDGDSVMMTPDGSDTIEDSVITDGNSITFGPKSSTTQWRTLTSSVGNYS